MYTICNASFAGIAKIIYQWGWTGMVIIKKFKQIGRENTKQNKQIKNEKWKIENENNRENRKIFKRNIKKGKLKKNEK